MLLCERKEGLWSSAPASSLWE